MDLIFCRKLKIQNFSIPIQNFSIPIHFFLNNQFRNWIDPMSGNIPSYLVSDYMYWVSPCRPFLCFLSFSTVVLFLTDLFSSSLPASMSVLSGIYHFPSFSTCLMHLLLCTFTLILFLIIDSVFAFDVDSRHWCLLFIDFKSSSGCRCIHLCYLHLYLSVTWWNKHDVIGKVNELWCESPSLLRLFYSLSSQLKIIRNNLTLHPLV